MNETRPQDHPRAFRGGLAPALLLLLLSAIVSLVWSHAKLLSQDEFFVLQTDSLRSYAQLVQVQLHWPISLDPLVYHTLAWLGCRIFGAGAFAIRLPSLVGYLTLQLCLFFFVRRFAGERAGLIALVIPALTQTFFYSTEGRPYGLMLGLFGLVMVSWQSATHAAPEQSRRLSLITLALSLGLLLNTHYFAVLLLIPIWLAEGVRTLQRRKLDVPVVASLFIGTACAVFAVPFSHSAAEFKKHYYNAGGISLRTITQAYRSLFVDYTQTSMLTQRLTAIVLVLLTLLFLWGCLVQLRKHQTAIRLSETTLLVTLLALPFFGYFLAVFATHSIEVRYVLGAIAGFAALLATLCAPLLENKPVARVLPTILAALILAVGVLHITHERAATRRTLASYVLPAKVKAAILASPSRRLYLQNMGEFEAVTYYEPDPFLRNHITLVYSNDEELRWDRHDTVSLTADHMRHFTGFDILPFDELKKQPGDHVFVVYHSGWDWTDQGFAAAGAQVTPLGQAMDGDAVSVRFPQNTP